MSDGGKKTKTKKPADEPANNPDTKPTDEPINNPDNKPPANDDKPAKKPAKKSAKKSAKEPAKEPAKESENKSASLADVVLAAINMNLTEEERAALKQKADEERQERIRKIILAFRTKMIEKRKQKILRKEADSDTAKRCEELLVVWQNFQEAWKEQTGRNYRIDQAVRRLESSVDRIGKFCGEYQLLWKIRGFKRCFVEAEEGTRTVLYSPVFDTHRNGYKIQISMCPNGDGKVKGKAMSVFFTIHKGPYDSMLKWPFLCQITLTLVSQTELTCAADPMQDSTSQYPLQENGVVVNTHEQNQPPLCRDHSLTFYPNDHPGNAPFLNRPVEDKNRSLGFQRFILLSDLFEGDYIKEDTIYIKALVDVSDI